MTTVALLQVTFPLVLDTYEFCSADLKKQLDGPRVAVREEEDRKANKDRAAKKAKMVSILQYGLTGPYHGCVGAAIQPFAISVTASH